MAELDELAAEITSWAGHLAAATARWLGLIARFDRLEGYACWECTSCAQWLGWRCGLDLRSAREHVRVARCLEELPLIRSTFERGELSYSKVRAITRVATPETEADLVMLASHGTAAHVERIVAAWRRVTEQAELSAARVRHERRELAWYHDDDGTVVLRVRLPPEAGALVLQAIDHADTRSGHEPGVDHRARRADALAAVASAYLDGARDAATQERYQVHVHVDADVLSSADAPADTPAQQIAADGSAGRCHLDHGPALAAETARRLACDATLVRLVDGPDEPIALGRRTRAIPPVLRRYLRARDEGRCRFPGCSHRRVEIHHLRHWAHGGRTDADNLLSLCSFHHHRVHEGGWTVRRHPDGQISFTDRHGWTPVEHDALSGSAEHLRTALGTSVTPDGIASRWAGEPLDLHHLCDSVAHRAGPPPRPDPDPVRSIGLDA